MKNEKASPRKSRSERRETYSQMLKRLTAEWEAKQHEQQFREVLEEWAFDPICALRDRLQEKIPDCTPALLFRLMKLYPDLRQTYEAGVEARMECAKLFYLESAMGVNELGPGRAIQCQFLLRGYDPKLIRRQEVTGKEGGPVEVRVLPQDAVLLPGATS